MRNVVAVILAGGQGERLSVLSLKRAKPAVPFAGKYRIIDFTLSNCVNSGIYDVAVLTQYRPHSLHDHIGVGKPWDLDRTTGGVRLLQPYLGRGESDWYRGTADAVYQNLPFLIDSPPKADQVALVLSGDHIYKMDYGPMLDFHRQIGADATLAVISVPWEEASRFGTVVSDPEGRILDFEEKVPRPRSNLASMGVYVFDLPLLAERLKEDAALNTQHDFGRDILPRIVQQDKVYAYLFRGYWRDVGTLASYWETNMALLEPEPEFNLYDKDWVIHTRSEERPPAHIEARAKVTRSLISDGCYIEGMVDHSVLSPGVWVGPGAVVRDSILMTDGRVGAGAILNACILDKEVVAGDNCRLGEPDSTGAAHEQGRPPPPLVIIGKRAHLPPGLVVGGDSVLDADLDESDFPESLRLPRGSVLRSGSLLGRIAAPGELPPNDGGVP